MDRRKTPPQRGRVTPQRLAEERTKLRAWEDAHLDLVAEIKALVSKDDIR